jgi:hypothetical protein
MPILGAWGALLILWLGVRRGPLALKSPPIYVRVRNHLLHSCSYSEALSQLGEVRTLGSPIHGVGAVL